MRRPKGIRLAHDEGAEEGEDLRKRWMTAWRFLPGKTRNRFKDLLVRKLLGNIRRVRFPLAADDPRPDLRADQEPDP